MIFAGEPSLLFHSGRAVMERGGSLLRLTNPRNPLSVTARFLLFRDRSHLRCDGASRGSSHRPRKFMLENRFRSLPHWREGYQAMYNTLQKSQYSLRVLSSCDPQEVDTDGMEISRNKYLIDCGVDQPCAVGGIVALGKFDALHIGHRELAIQASKVGIPFLISFAGIAEVLGWESRPAIVAKCDRKRILSSWAPYCGNIAPLEYQIDFSTVRSLTPRQFVERLSKELKVAGVVAGENYRFGYKASGNAQDLVRLCKEYGLSVHIVSPVMDHRCSHSGASISTNFSGPGQVSSTRVRHALAMRDMDYVVELLGRKHRLLLMPTNGEYKLEENMIMVLKSCMLNQPPGDGEFSNCTILWNDVSVGFCRVVIDSKSIRIELESEIPSTINLVQEDKLIGIEFG